ncbi:hypothetical protein [Arthrobacter psychrolactophilus]
MTPASHAEAKEWLDGDLLGPAQHDVFADPLAVPRADAGFVSAIGLVERA